MESDQPSPKTRERAMQLFLDLYRLSERERSDRIDTECGDDAELRAAIEDLLAHHDAPRSQLQAVEDLVEGETRPLSEPVVRPGGDLTSTADIPDVRNRGDDRPRWTRRRLAWASRPISAGPWRSR